MTVTYEIHAERRLVFVWLDGALTFADLCEAEDRLFAEPTFQHTFDALVEIRVVTAVPSEAMTRKLAVDRVARATTQPLGRLALVAMTRLGFEFASTLELYLDGRGDGTRVFTDSTDARRWLGV